MSKDKIVRKHNKPRPPRGMRLEEAEAAALERENQERLHNGGRFGTADQQFGEVERDDLEP